MRQQPQVGDAGQLLRCDTHQVRIAVADEARHGGNAATPARTAASMSLCDEQRITMLALRATRSLQRPSSKFVPCRRSRRHCAAASRRDAPAGRAAPHSHARHRSRRPAARSSTDQVFIAGVEHPQHDVGLATADTGGERMGDQLDGDMAMAVEEGRHPRHQPVCRERRADRQLDDAARRLAARGDGGLGAGCGRCHRLGVFAKAAALRGQCQAFRRSREQARAEGCLQRGDLAAHRRMARAQPPRGAAVVAGLRDRGEVFRGPSPWLSSSSEWSSFLSDCSFNIEHPSLRSSPIVPGQQVNSRG